MRKILVVLVVVMCLTILSSCRNPIDESDFDSIIGVWKPIIEVGIHQSGNKQIYEYSISEQENKKLIFSANETFNGYYNGTWEILDGNLYITENRTTEEVTFFELTNSKLRISSFSCNSYENRCSTTSQLSEHYNEYIRVTNNGL